MRHLIKAAAVAFVAPLPLFIWLAMFVASVFAGDIAEHRGTMTGPIDDSRLKSIYARLVELADGNGHHCMIANAGKAEMLESLRRFGKAVHFIDLDPNKPIKAELPEDYYNPQGPTVTFDQFELAVDRMNPSNAFLSMTRTSEGVLLEPKLVFEMSKDHISCVKYLSVVVPYAAPSQ